MKDSMQFKKIIYGLSIMLIFLGVLLTTNLIQADAGPKPQIILTIKNAPSELFYVDLLVQNQNMTDSLLSLNMYDAKMIEALKSQENMGWYPALVNGTQTRMMGDIIPDSDNQEIIFTYTQSIPDYFKLILVTQSGKITISEPIQTKAFLTRLEFDAQSGKVSAPNWLLSYSTIFISMLIPTFLIEGLLLWAFGLFNRHNVVVFTITNLLTQVFLFLTSAYAYYYFGLILAILVVILDEGIILLVETVIFAKFLNHPSLKRKIVYGMSANILSFIGGLILAMYFQ